MHQRNDDEQISQQISGCGASACCNPSSSLHRFMVLALMCLVGFGSYFCYDNPSTLLGALITDLNLSTSQFVWLYSVYPWPNVIVCFFAGFLIDRVFGIRLATIIFISIVLIGQLIFAIGGLVNQYWLMVLGRFLFGTGTNSLEIALVYFAALWFKGKELNMAFGLLLSLARVGGAVNVLVVPPVYNYVRDLGYESYYRTGIVLLIATLACVLSLLGALVLGWMDERAARILRSDENSPKGAVAKLSDISTFKITFWMVTVICIAYYVAIFPFTALATVFLERKFDISAETSNTVLSTLSIVAGVTCPIIGLIIDRTGRNVFWIFQAIVLTMVAHGLLAFTNCNPYIAMITLGIGYSTMASSLWGLVAWIIPECRLGTALGICYSLSNLRVAVMFMLAGEVLDKGGYLMLEIFFIGWLVVALIATIVIWVHNTNNNGVLNMTPVERASVTSKPQPEESTNMLERAQPDNL